MISVHRATSADVPEIEDLVRAAYSIYVPRIGREPAPMTADYGAVVAAGTVLVAREGEDSLGGRLVGLLVLHLRHDHLFIENLAVAPTVQGRGIGARLLERADGVARTHGVHELRLYTNARMTENLSYYPRRGFAEVGRGHDDGFDRVFFSRRLPDEVVDPE